MNYSTRGSPLWIFPALATALVFNSILFLLLPLLSVSRPAIPDFSPPMELYPARMFPEEVPPEEEEIKEPESEQPEERPEFFLPDMIPPRPQALDFAPLPIEINMKLMAGADFGSGLFYDAEALDQPPRPLVKMPPVYPFKAKRLEIEGQVKVKFLVDDSGAVSRISILEASPEGLFEDSVRKSLPAWKFMPGMLLGEPVSSWAVTTIKFELR